MSLRATSWAFEQNLPSTGKFVLVALADHADERGLCWPSVARLAQRTGLSERAVRGALRELEVSGMIVTERRDGFMSRYTLALATTAAAPEGGPASIHQGAVPDAGGQQVPGGMECRGADAASPPGTSCPPPRHVVQGTPAPAAPEPSRTVTEPSGNLEGRTAPPATLARSRGTRLSPDWQPSAEDCRFAIGLGLDPAAVAAAFRDYWCALPGAKALKLDWSMTFHNDCRRTAERKMPVRPSLPRRTGPANLPGDLIRGRMADRRPPMRDVLSEVIG